MTTNTMMTTRMPIPQVLATLHMVVLVVGFAVSGWWEDPMAFYGDFYTPVFLDKPIPTSSIKALEHGSIVLLQCKYSTVQYSSSIVVVVVGVWIERVEISV
jgi:hypothetical protein